MALPQQLVESTADCQENWEYIDKYITTRYQYILTDVQKSSASTQTFVVPVFDGDKINGIDFAITGFINTTANVGIYFRPNSLTSLNTYCFEHRAWTAGGTTSHDVNLRSNGGALGGLQIGSTDFNIGQDFFVEGKMTTRISNGHHRYLHARYTNSTQGGSTLNGLMTSTWVDGTTKVTGGDFFFAVDGFAANFSLDIMELVVRTW